MTRSSNMTVFEKCNSNMIILGKNNSNCMIIEFSNYNKKSAKKQEKLKGQKLFKS